MEILYFKKKLHYIKLINQKCDNLIYEITEPLFLSEFITDEFKETI